MEVTKRFIAIAGNMGVGKSTLTELLAKRLGWEPFYEAVAENPYIADFYKEMKTWAFHSQVFFLTHRLHDHNQIIQRPHSVIQDRCVYEDAEVFAKNLYLQGDMAERDYRVYRDLYETLTQFLPPPDIVLYLQASVPILMRRITSRGRDYERNVTPQYLEQLNNLYNEWVANFTLCPVLVMPVDELDFVKYKAHLEEIATWLIHKGLPEFYKTLPSHPVHRKKKIPQQSELPGEW
ncbi:MAG: deoxynucleoside kinase [Chloroflexi bacterium]|nr:deoxynucleoside kinase [Chloroflexota bacterium]